MGRCAGVCSFHARQIRHAWQYQGLLALVVLWKRPTTDQSPKKIRDRQLAFPAESKNLQALVINELKTKKHTATEGLLWLVRYVYLFVSYKTGASRSSDPGQRSGLHRARVTPQRHNPI